MKILILGSTGMLGQSLMNYYLSKDIFVKGLARTDADYNIDISQNLSETMKIIRNQQFDVVINTIALINLQYCEENPMEAYYINTYFPGEIAKLCDEMGIYFVQISTDHYYDIDCLTHLHSEIEPVQMLNEYSKTKYLAEQLTLLYPTTLVVRTNIVGLRNRNNLTFVEWIIDSLINNKSITGYSNMYTSSIDVESFVPILHAAIQQKIYGLINIAADGVLSKYEFIMQIASKLHKSDNVTLGYLKNGTIKRGHSLGLSVAKLKGLMPQVTIPTALDVTENIYAQFIKKERRDKRCIIHGLK